MTNQDNGQSFGNRQMFQGDWHCSECDAPITSLPFQPSGDRPIFCRDCHRQKQSQRQSFGGDRQMFQGDWNCSECNAPITSLPFKPNGEKPIFCSDCHRQRRS